jgi:hypothetical protein
MRCTSMTLFFVLFALAMTQLAVSHFLMSEFDMATEYPTGQEWEEHRKQSEELEKKILECQDPVELEKLYLQHAALIEKWKQRNKPTS